MAQNQIGRMNDDSWLHEPQTDSPVQHRKTLSTKRYAGQQTCDAGWIPLQSLGLQRDNRQRIRMTLNWTTSRHIVISPLHPTAAKRYYGWKFQHDYWSRK